MSSFEEESSIYFKDVYNACQVDMPELENTLKDEDKDQDKDKDKGSIWVTSHSRSEPHCRVDTGCQMRLQKKSPWQQSLLQETFGSFSGKMVSLVLGGSVKNCLEL